MTQTMVRMGELATSASAGHVLSSIGLGSCIGLALVDRATGAAGLAHIMLPSSEGGRAEAGDAKYADLGVPALLERMVRHGSSKRSLEAVLVGGAQMFSFAGKGAALEIGKRNADAVHAQLARIGIPVRAAATGGSKGRTIRVTVGELTVTVREAGSAEEELYSTRSAKVTAR